MHAGVDTQDFVELSGSGGQQTLRREASNPYSSSVEMQELHSYRFMGQLTPFDGE